MNRKHIEEVFAAYTDGYDPDDPKIKLKIEHTYNVAALAEDIAMSLGAQRTVPQGSSDFCSAQVIAVETAPDPDFAWLTGMLHDIGRFEQVKRYGTFSDAASVDHAQFGADLLFKEGLITEFLGMDDNSLMPENGMELLELAIRSHSLYRLPEDLTMEEAMYCNILRDADKIDIFRVNCETPLEDIYNVSTAELKASALSEEVKQCFLERHTVLRSLKKHPADFVVGHICLAFELVYPRSAEIAREQGYVNRLLSFESDNPDTREFFEYMRSHIWE